MEDEYSRTIEVLRRENAALQEGAEDYRDIHGHEYQEALDRAQTYAEELTAANEELHLTNEELHQINETLNAQRDELIAAREKAEKERRRYYDLFDAAPDGYLMTDRNGTRLEANQAMQSLLAVHRESLKTRNLVHFVAEGSRGEFRIRLARAADGTPQQDFELQLQSLEREPVYVSVSIASEHPEADVASLRWIVRDITERKRAEEALARRTDDLVRLNREVEAARDEANMYLDIMTHDVRNANNVSSMYADLMVELLSGDLWLHARKLRDSIQRSSEILRNVATIRRLRQESDRLVPVNLDAVVKEEIGNFAGASIECDSQKVDVLADGLLPVVFTNLLGNAVKFGGPDVEIAIRVEGQNGKVLISVEDTGPGVPDEVKRLLFQRFERGMARGSGEGLGLYIVRTLVERYGGKVWVDDRVPGRPEEGAAFRFTLRKVA
ncbi:ATP-binding protein [Methanoculleus sp.]|jgi:PAS domain S-box-containing protein|uniref:PAS domain-containing sensor histidine kinase n=1 Tax=Methanoculleus sp. TaxID=90427 RepID=UPI001BD1E8E2|nr:ATP-binding protein [Methanoculleus sp.]